jgi:flagellar biosynthesis protein FliQ
MDEALFISLSNKALITIAIIAVPILIPGLIVGVLISLFQAVTQIQEQTLTFVPKLFIMIISYLVTGPWIIRFLSNYSIEVINKVAEIGLGGA